MSEVTLQKDWTFDIVSMGEEFMVGTNLNFVDIPIRLKQVAQLLREGGGHGRHRPA